MLCYSSNKIQATLVLKKRGRTRSKKNFKILVTLSELVIKQVLTQIVEQVTRMLLLKVQSIPFNQISLLFDLNKTLLFVFLLKGWIFDLWLLNSFFFLSQTFFHSSHFRQRFRLFIFLIRGSRGDDSISNLVIIIDYDHIHFIIKSNMSQ